MQHQMAFADLKISRRSFIRLVLPVDGKSEEAHVEIPGFDNIKDSHQWNRGYKF
jgi:hypothetical protein